MKILEEGLTAIIDTREQNLLDLSPMKTVTGSLQTGDYSIVGLENVICAERKSVPDFQSCVGRQRERFQRELMRLKAYPMRMVVIEGDWRDLGNLHPSSKVTKAAVEHSLISWSCHYNIPFLLAGDHEEAAKIVKRFLFTGAKKIIERQDILIKNMGFDLTITPH